MIRLFATFLFAIFAGLFIQSTWVKYLAPGAIAPDFILILVVYVGLTFRTPWGALGAFVLGVAADLASARYVGPNAAAAVAAFYFVTTMSGHMFAEKDLVTGFLTFLASLVKSIVFLIVLWFYLGIGLKEDVVWIVGMEALITAILTPIVLKLLRPGRRSAFTRRLESDVYR